MAEEGTKTIEVDFAGLLTLEAAEILNDDDDDDD